jgi:hypothetical protein
VPHLQQLAAAHQPSQQVMLLLLLLAGRLAARLSMPPCCQLVQAVPQAGDEGTHRAAQPCEGLAQQQDTTTSSAGCATGMDAYKQPPRHMPAQTTAVLRCSPTLAALFRGPVSAVATSPHTASQQKARRCHDTRLFPPARPATSRPSQSGSASLAAASSPVTAEGRVPLPGRITAAANAAAEAANTSACWLPPSTSAAASGAFPGPASRYGFRSGSSSPLQGTINCDGWS